MFYRGGDSFTECVELVDGGRCDGLVRRRQWSCEPLLPCCPCSSSFLPLFLSSLPLYFFSFCLPACLTDCRWRCLSSSFVSLKSLHLALSLECPASLGITHGQCMRCVCVCVRTHQPHHERGRATNEIGRMMVCRRMTETIKGAGLTSRRNPERHSQEAWVRNFMLINALGLITN